MSTPLSGAVSRIFAIRCTCMAQAAEQFMEYAQNVCGFGLMAVSLGYFDTLLSMSGSTTSSELNESEKASAGVQCNMSAPAAHVARSSCARLCNEPVTIPHDAHNQGFTCTSLRIAQSAQSTIQHKGGCVRKGSSSLA